MFVCEHRKSLCRGVRVCPREREKTEFILFIHSLKRTSVHFNVESKIYTIQDNAIEYTPFPNPVCWHVKDLKLVINTLSMKINANKISIHVSLYHSSMCVRTDTSKMKINKHFKECLSRAAGM